MAKKNKKNKPSVRDTAIDFASFVSDKYTCVHFTEPRWINMDGTKQITSQSLWSEYLKAKQIERLKHS